MDLTFTAARRGHRAEGEEFSYLVARSPAGATWVLTIYSGGEPYDISYHDTRALAEATARAYEMDALWDRRPYYSRHARAIIAAYEEVLGV